MVAVATLHFNTVTVEVSPRAVLSRFHDGEERLFCLVWASTNPAYRQVALEMGYTDPRRYAVEHDLTHHWLADHLGQPYSRAIHDGDPRVPIGEAPQDIQDEEHLVNSLQQMLRLGRLDPHGRVDELRLTVSDLMGLVSLWRAAR